MGLSIILMKHIFLAFATVLALTLTFSSCHQSGTTADASVSGGEPAALVNVFLGTSGDHGQLSPSASYPFSMISVGPETYPAAHTGYEYYAKEFLGFTHTHLEGVGCRGSGGNILIKPFLGPAPDAEKLIRKSQTGHPGYYHVAFTNGVEASFTVAQNAGLHHYTFPEGDKGIYIDLGHALANRFIAEAHSTDGNTLTGWVETYTTCHAGKNKLFFSIVLSEAVTWQESDEHVLIATPAPGVKDLSIQIAFSSVDGAHAQENLPAQAFDDTRTAATKKWNDMLNHFAVKGEQERVALFYSLLYRALQAPYKVSEKDGSFKATNGTIQKADHPTYNGWAIWDNYRTQLPLLSLAYPEEYQNMAVSIANLYRYGKKNWATPNEPSPTVRTEHAIVVLLDAYRKGYKIAFNEILDSLVREQKHLDYGSPDKALESSYDTWALAEIYKILGKEDSAKYYYDKALQYKEYWNKDFKDITAKDVDRMQARGLYQGTIWQYRWFVPFDIKGLMALTGGEDTYIAQLDEFFDNDYYNHANQPDLQVPIMYQPTHEPWKSQALMHKLAVDTVVQYYFNENVRGVDPYIGKIYHNQPAAYIRTMDDDAGTMSSWYVWASCGMHPACIGWPVYYLHLPLLQEITLQCPEGKTFTITVKNYNPDYAYVQSATLNGEPLERNWLTQEEIWTGGTLEFTAASTPNKAWGVTEPWIPGDEGK